MIFMKVIALLFLAVEINCRQITLGKKPGEIKEYSRADNSYRIKAGKRNQIIISVNRLRLGTDGYLKMRDGRNGEEQIYTMIGSEVYKTSDSTRIRERVTLPIVMETKTAKLFITEHGDGRRDGFTASYASYPSDGCIKEDLDLTFGDAEKTCDTAELAPIASSCDVTLSCDENYVQYDKKMICNGDGDWDGHVECQPKRKLIARCSYDFDELTTNNGCPFTNTQVAEYFINVGSVDVFVSSLERTQGRRKVDCRKTCLHDAAGRFARSCPNRLTKANVAVYVRCLVCRVMHGCGRDVVYL